MGIIKILDENVTNIIAAGEVVENPASMIKEIYENSIDALATQIEISTDSKLSYFKIIDNGVGMSKEDLYLSIERHATSKLETKEDIFNLKTFGFRGEALASISSVSKMTLSSKREEDKVGHKITVFGGKILNATDFAMKRGTIIEIRDLFYNTPARKKFLRKESTELTAVKDILMKLALSNAKTATRFLVDGKEVIKTSAKDMDNTLFEILGKNVFKNLKKFKYGYLGNDQIYRGSKNYIYSFVNSRFCKSNVIERAVIDGYYTKLMKNKYPFAIILYDIAASEVDVNVHPSKKIVKFSDDKIVYKQIRTAIEDFFYEEDRANFKVEEINNYVKEENNTILPNTNNVSLFEYKEEEVKQEEKKYDIMGQVFNTYIILRNDEHLDFYDQHAMHERIKYEALKEKYYNQTMAKKQLLIPELIDLSLVEKDIVLQNMKIFNDFCFEIDQISENQLVLRAAPDFEFRNSYTEIIKSIIESLIENKNVTDIREKIIISMACRSSIMAGQKLTFNEMETLIKKLYEINKFNCPHGRPVISKIDKNLLDKMAKRKL